VPDEVINFKHEYLVTYAHEDATQEDSHGWGVIKVALEDRIKTKADLYSVAAFIGRDRGFTKVGIVKIVETNDADEEIELDLSAMTESTNE